MLTIQANFLHLDAEYKYNQSHNETKENAAKSVHATSVLRSFGCVFIFLRHIARTSENEISKLQNKTKL